MAGAAEPPDAPEVTRAPSGAWVGRFEAMASPCEVLAQSDRDTAREALSRARAEAFRIERKFSRYRADSVIQKIHAAAGAPVEVDAETADLLDFAHRCWELSDGAFDVTTGVLRRVWSFHEGARVPAPAEVDVLLPHVGWSRVEWARPWIRLPAGMEIDLGGLGKEYAVDRAVAALEGLDGSFLVNFGGDLRAGGRAGEPWTVGVENPDHADEAAALVHLTSGALATSGDSRRVIVADGIRYGHILDPRTGWPVRGAPRSVTVHAPVCTEAGLLATLALLQGPQAEAFLRDQGVAFWCRRDPA